MLHKSFVHTANDQSDAGTTRFNTKASMINVCSEHNHIISLGARPYVVQLFTIEVMVHISHLDVEIESMVRKELSSKILASERFLSNCKKALAATEVCKAFGQSLQVVTLLVDQDHGEICRAFDGIVEKALD
jgi:hypothetical protein